MNIINPNWLEPNAVVPVDAETTGALVQAVRALQAELDWLRAGELTDDMLRYAMGAMGIGSPDKADLFRAFWRLAIEARNTAPRPPLPPP